MVISNVLVVILVAAALGIASVHEVGHSKYLDTANHSFILDMEAGDANYYLLQMAAYAVRQGGFFGT